MTGFIWTAATGWLAVLVFCSAVAIPYLVARRTAAALRPHAWLGFIVVAVALTHAMAPGRAMRGANPTGLVVATIALFGLVWQVAIGAGLRQSVGEGRGRERRIHFWTMVAIALLLAFHVVLNRVP